MRVKAFLAELRERDVELRTDGERLRCNAPAGVLTPELVERLRQRKCEILDFLRTAEAVATQQRAIVPLQPHGVRTPVFGVPGHNGDVFCYRDLVKHLGDDQPFYGLQPPGLDDHEDPIARVEDLAAYFAAQIQASQPSGPYVIAGYCAGGAIALELARQLQQRGADVRFLALFGCPYPTYYRFLTRLPYWIGRVFTHLRVAATLPSFGERRRYLAERLRARVETARRESSPAATDPVSLARFRVEQATIRAVRRYSAGRYSGRVGLFLPNTRWRDATMLRWRRVARHIEEYFGPDDCNARFMLLEPDAPAFARLFRQAREKFPGEGLA